MITYQEEKFSKVVFESYPLIEAHHREVDPMRDVAPLKLDMETYLTMEKAGHIVLCTARRDKGLVGYHLNFINQSHHSKNTTYAINDVVYVVPELRGGTVPVRLFQFAEEKIRERGVRVITTTMIPGHGYEKLLDFLGYKEMEVTYSKVIRRDS